MKKYIKTLVLIFLVLTINACKEDFLERAPDDQINENTLFTKWDKVNDYANRAYWELRAYRDRGIVTLNHFSLSGITDECKGTKVQNGIPDLFNSGSFGPSTGMVRYGAEGIYWGDVYSSVRLCNKFLEGVEKYKSPDNPLDPGDLQKRVAEIHFMRAYFHFLIFRFYGDIVYLDRIPGITESFQRMSWTEALPKFIADLDYAIENLPVRHKQIDFGRVEKGTAMALKAILLYINASPIYNGGKFPGNDTRTGKETYSTYNKEKWKLAAEAAKALMDLKDDAGAPRYTLYTGQGSAWQAESGNKVYARLKQLYIDFESIKNEFIFVLARNKPEAWQRDHLPPSKTGASRLQPLQEQVDEYEFIGNDGYGYPIYDSQATAKGYDDKNPYVNRDPRFYSDVMYHGSTYQNSVINTETGNDKIGANNATSTGYYLRKFYHEDWKVSGSWSLHFPIIRLPEIQLIYCEAMNKYYGPSAEIYTVLNNLRSRSFMAPVPPGLSEEELHKYIQRERRVELFYENKRYFYSRWNLEPTSDTELAREQEWNTSSNPSLPYPRTQKVVHGMKPVIDTNGKITIGSNKYRMERFKLEDRVFTSKNYFWPLTTTDLANDPGLIQNPNW